MNYRNQLAAFSAVFLLIGLSAGSLLTYQQMDDRISDLEQQVEESRLPDSERNFTFRNAWTDLFDSVDQSVVSVRTYGEGAGQGSGFIYSEDGYIVTNEHVIEDASRVEVSFLDGSTRRATVVGSDPYTDLAVLQVNKRNLRPLNLADSSQVNVGQPAVAVGNPFGLRTSITAGIISQKGRSLRTQGGFSTPNVLQTDAAINPGNSGGPLLDPAGRVVGVNTAIETNTGTFSGVGFAIPSNTVKRVVPSLIEDGEHSHSWIGVSGVDVSPEIAEQMNLGNSTGFLVVDVVQNSPADSAGLRAGERTAVVNGREVLLGGDVITQVENEKIRGINDLLLYLARDTSPGDTVEFTVIRDGEEIEVPVTLGARSDQ